MDISKERTGNHLLAVTGEVDVADGLAFFTYGMLKHDTGLLTLLAELHKRVKHLQQVPVPVEGGRRL